MIECLVDLGPFGAREKYSTIVQDALMVSKTSKNSSMECKNTTMPWAPAYTHSGHCWLVLITHRATYSWLGIA